MPPTIVESEELLLLMVSLPSVPVMKLLFMLFCVIILPATLVLVPVFVSVPEPVFVSVPEPVFVSVPAPVFVVCEPNIVNVFPLAFGNVIEPELVLMTTSLPLICV